MSCSSARPRARRRCPLIVTSCSTGSCSPAPGPPRPSGPRCADASAPSGPSAGRPSCSRTTTSRGTPPGWPIRSAAMGPARDAIAKAAAVLPAHGPRDAVPVLRRGDGDGRRDGAARGEHRRAGRRVAPRLPVVGPLAISDADALVRGPARRVQRRAALVAPGPGCRGAQRRDPVGRRRLGAPASTAGSWRPGPSSRRSRTARSRSCARPTPMSLAYRRMRVRTGGARAHRVRRSGPPVAVPRPRRAVAGARWPAPTDDLAERLVHGASHTLRPYEGDRRGPWLDPAVRGRGPSLGGPATMTPDPDDSPGDRSCRSTS